MKQIKIKNFGQLKEADLQFGDLTVLVGPQATGKSVFLQLVKLILDAGPIVSEFKKYGTDWSGSFKNFLDLYFGEGMSSIYRKTTTSVHQDGRKLDLESLIRVRQPEKKPERAFLIPAQRVITIKEGLTQPFQSYRSGDPYAVREFSDRLHQLVQTEFSKSKELFPVSNRLNKAYRDLVRKSVFGDYGLSMNTKKFEKRLVLNKEGRGNSDLPFLVWSAGQREFVPLLLGFYWLMPPAKVSMRNDIKWVMIEELEMGLHPNAISATIVLVLDLMRRGYKVCLSTHSPHVLDVVWALQLIKEHKAPAKKVIDMFRLPSNNATKALAQSTLKKDLRVHYFDRDGTVQDISQLDPGAEDPTESGWGGLSEFSGHIGDVVSDVVANGKASDDF